MPIGSDKPENSKAQVDPVVDAQRNLVANAATDPKDLLEPGADPVLHPQQQENSHPADDRKPR